MPDRVVRDSQREHIAVVLRHRSGVLANLGIFDTTTPIPAEVDDFCRRSYNAAEELVSQAKELMANKAKDALMERIAGAGQWAGCGANGKVWQRRHHRRLGACPPQHFAAPA